MLTTYTAIEESTCKLELITEKQSAEFYLAHTFLVSYVFHYFQAKT